MTEELFYAVFQTTAGWAGLLGSKAGLRRVILPQSSEKQVKNLLAVDSYQAVSSDKLFQDLIERLQAYYEGHPVDFDDKLDFSGGTDFQSLVWEATRLIPCGETRSYAWIAKQIGRPKASRAVGQALHRNPLPVIIPCHRVIASDGSLGGFGGGVEMKRYLLRLEDRAKTG
jgi:methylated-DNA-[protein]-cysteine S-methyltransferase